MRLCYFFQSLTASKLEKADILELTLSYLKGRQIQGNLVMPENYFSPFLSLQYQLTHCLLLSSALAFANRLDEDQAR